MIMLTNTGKKAPREDRPGEEIPLSPRRIGAIRRAVGGWFAREARALPWRESYDPYGIWICEIMLQQTRLDTALPYYRRWMAALPDVAAVAAAPQERVLKLWEGLGYYARARNLHAAARLMVRRHGGRVPERLDALLALPGIGRYTAGAIASIGYNRPAPVVDGNVGRVLGRVFALEVPMRSPEGQARLWALATALVPRSALPEGGARRFNQGLMELGALICRRTAPRCTLCPLRDRCGALRSGHPERLPPAAARPGRPLRRGALLLLRDGEGSLLLRKRPARGLWGGLWEPPWRENAGRDRPAATLRRLMEALACPPETRPVLLGGLLHGLTHFRLELTCYAGRAGPRAAKEPAGAIPPNGMRWVGPAELEALPLARFARKALAMLERDEQKAPGRGG